MSYNNGISDPDWRENKKLILKTLEDAGIAINKHEKQLQDLKLHLQKIESNTEVIKTWMRSETIDNKKIAEKQKQGRISMIVPIVTAIISSLTTLVGILLSGILDKIQ